jgi:hypothetical protein
MKVLWIVLGVIAGIVAAGLIVTIAEMAGMKAYPPPPGLNPNNPEQMKEIIRLMPVAAMLFVLVGYTFGAYAGSAVAMLISRRNLIAGLIPAVLFLAATAFNLAILPSPVWFNVAAFVLELAAIALAILPLRRKPVLATA